MPHSRQMIVSCRYTSCSTMAYPASFSRELNLGYERKAILTDRRLLVAPGLEDGGSVEHTKGPRDDQVAAQRIPPESTHDERSHVFHCLQGGKGLPGHHQIGDPGTPNRRIVGQTNGAADRHGVITGDEGCNQLLQRVGSHQSVGIDGAHQRAGRDVHPGIQRVRLAPVELVDQYQSGLSTRSIDALHIGRGHHLLVDGMDRPQIEVGDEHLGSGVGRPVVDHDDLEVRIRQGQKPIHGLGDRDLLVVGRHQDRHLGSQR